MNLQVDSGYRGVCLQAGTTLQQILQEKVQWLCTVLRAPSFHSESSPSESERSGSGGKKVRAAGSKKAERATPGPKSVAKKVKKKPAQSRRGSGRV